MTAIVHKKQDFFCAGQFWIFTPAIYALPFLSSSKMSHRTLEAGHFTCVLLGIHGIAAIVTASSLLGFIYI
jgi:hypothetical protein